MTIGKVMTRGTNNRLVIWLSIMAGLQSIAGASVVTEMAPPLVGGSVAMIVGALNAATAAYIAGTKPIHDPRDQ